MSLLMQPSKCAVTMELLGLQRLVNVTFDGRHPDVDVPVRFRKDARVTIQIAYELPIPIRDLSVHPVEGIVATLSFDEGRFRCEVPWAAVWAVQDPQGNGIVWEDQIPASVRKGEPRGPERDRPTRPGFRRSRLRLVRLTPDDPSDAGPTAA